MKKGLLTTIVLALVCMLFFVANVIIAADFPNDITISNDGYKKDIKTPVNFSHMIHSTDYGIDCTECHHNYEDGQNVWQNGDPVKKCVECHDPNTNQGNAKKLMMAFHDNCQKCHKDQNKEGKNAPVKCDDCHKK